jgi:hypothetical protein
MATIIPFIPSNFATPKIAVTLDGQPYQLVMTWNVSAQRYYVNVYAVDGTWVTTVPLFGSPVGEAINAISYDALRGAVTMTKSVPGLPRKPGQMVDYTLSNFQPGTYNGKQRCLTIDNSNFSFPSAADPGQVVVMGSVHRILNMVAGLFTTSTLCFRNGCFEVDP